MYLLVLVVVASPDIMVVFKCVSLNLVMRNSGRVVVTSAASRTSVVMSTGAEVDTDVDELMSVTWSIKSRIVVISTTFSVVVVVDATSLEDSVVT